MALIDCLKKAGFSQEEIDALRKDFAVPEGQTEEQAFLDHISVLEQQELDQMSSIRDQLGIEIPEPVQTTEEFKLTPEAEEILNNEKGVPAFISKKLEKVAKDNEVEITDSMTPNDVIEALRDKKKQGQIKQDDAQETQTEDQTTETQESTVQVDKPSDVNEGDVVKYGGINYNVANINDKGGFDLVGVDDRNFRVKDARITDTEFEGKIVTEPAPESPGASEDVSPENIPPPQEEDIDTSRTGPQFGRFTDRILKSDLDESTKKKIREISKDADTVSHKRATVLADAYVDTNGVNETLEELKNLDSIVWSSGEGVGVNVGKRLLKEFKNDSLKQAQIFEAINRGVRESGRTISRLADQSQLTPEDRLFAFARSSHAARTEKLNEKIGDVDIATILDGIDLSISEETIDNAIAKANVDIKPTNQEDITRGRDLVSEAMSELRALGLGSGPILLSDDGIKALTKLFKGLSLQFKGNISKIRDSWNNSLKDSAEDTWNAITKTTDVLKDAAKIRSQNIKDIVSDHIKNPDFSTIEEKLINEGVDIKLAGRLSKTLRDSISAELESRKGAIQDQIARLGGNSIKHTEALIDVARDGLLHQDQVADAVLKSLGLEILSQRDFTELNNLLDDVQKATSKRQKTRIENQIIDKISQLQISPKKQTLDFMLGMFYTGILSHLGTQKVALVGAGFGAFFEMLAASGQVITKSPKSVFKAWGKAFTPEGFGSGLQAYREILDTGNVEAIQFLDDAPMHSMSAFQRYMNANHKNLAKTAFQGFWTLSTYLYRNLLAMDALLTSGLTESLAYIEAANETLAQHSNLKGSPEFYTRLNEMLGETNKDLLKQQVQSEINQGLIPKNESKTRLRELILENRNNDIQERALNRALQSILMNTEVSGLLPSSIVSFFSQAQNIKEDDHPAIASFKLLAKLLFPIVRVPANAVTRAYQFSPLLMIERGVVDPILQKATGRIPKVKSFDIKSRESKVGTLDPRERKAQLARSILGTTLGLVGLAMFGFGDEDEPFIRITGKGMEDFRLNSSVLGEDFKENRVQFRTRKGGKYSEGFKWEDTPFSWFFAPLGAITDLRLQGKDTSMSYLKIAEYAAKGVMDGSYDLSLTFLGDFIKAAEVGVKNPKIGVNYITNKPAGNYNEYLVYRELNRKMTPFLIPGTYKDLGNIYRDLADKPIPRVNRMSDFFLRDLGLLESFYAAEPVRDKFGNPVYSDFDFPGAPAALEDVVDNLWNGDKPTFPEYEILRGKSFVFPDDYNGSGIRGITTEDKALFKQTYKKHFKKLFNRNTKKIQRLDKEELNTLLDDIHDDARKATQKEILPAGKGTLSERYAKLKN
jgi:hypothetical protein